MDSTEFKFKIGQTVEHVAVPTLVATLYDNKPTPHRPAVRYFIVGYGVCVDGRIYLCRTVDRDGFAECGCKILSEIELRLSPGGEPAATEPTPA